MPARRRGRWVITRGLPARRRGRAAVHRARRSRETAARTSARLCGPAAPARGAEGWRSSGACTRVGASGGAPSARTSALAARLNLAPRMCPSMAAVVGAPRTWREMPARCLAT
eukprot:scaffold31448_cov34-Phaeocystis_antarctica.AAC.3